MLRSRNLNNRPWKRWNKFFSTSPGKLKNKAISAFCICVWAELVQGNHVIIVTSSFLKSFQNVFSPRENETAFSNSPVWRTLSKKPQLSRTLPSLRTQTYFRLSVEPVRAGNMSAFAGYPNTSRGKNASFSNFFGVVWTENNWRVFRVKLLRLVTRVLRLACSDKPKKSA